MSGGDTQSRSSNRRTPAFFEALSARLKPARIEGFVDTVLAGEILGWAMDAGRPNRRVHVVAVAEGVVVAEALADLPRRDLIALGKGDGRYGFRLRMPKDLSEGARAAITVEAVSSPRNVPIKKGQVSLPKPSHAESPAKVAPPRQRAGFLERCSGGVIRGWAVDPRQPSTPAVVDIFNGEIFLGSVTCDEERPGLANGRGPEGARGFTFKIPAGLSVGEGGDVRARLANSRVELVRSKGYPGSKGAGGDAAQAAADPPPVFTLVDPGDRRAVVQQQFRAPSTRRPGPVLLLSDETESAGALDGLEPVNVDIGGRLDLARFAESAAVICLAPGQSLRPGLADLLRTAQGAADVWVWRTDAEKDDQWSAFPRLRLRLGLGAGCFAVSGRVLAGLPAPVAAGLARGDVAALAGELVDRPLMWRMLDAAFTEGGVQRFPVQPPAAPRRISVALWNGWSEEAAPPALEGLLERLAGRDLEILAPAGSMSAGVLADLESRKDIVTTRLVDAIQGAEGPMRHAMLRAATGEVVLLADGAEPAAIDVPVEALVAWCMDRDVGAVSAGSPSAAGEEAAFGETVGSSFAAVSRHAFAQIAPLQLHGGPAFELELARRLRSAGRANLRLPGGRAPAAPAAFSPAEQAWLAEALQ